MEEKLIAACGMNCGICMAYLREKNRCPGCRGDWEKDRTYLRKCVIRNCERLAKNNWKFCNSKCEKFPCLRLKNLDKRYRTKYGMSMIENLKMIEERGIEEFVKSEEKRWKCKKCG